MNGVFYFSVGRILNISDVRFLSRCVSIFKPRIYSSIALVVWFPISGCTRKLVKNIIYIKEPTRCSLAVCLFVTAVLLYMFRTLFASIFRSTYTQYDLVWMPSTLDALLDTSTRLMSLTRGRFYSL